jgi:hypothetical protein
MGPVRISSLLAAGLLSIAAAAPGAAAPVMAQTPPYGRANITFAATLRVMQELNFATLTATSAGTAVVNPNTEALTTTGGVLRVGGMAYSAMFEAVSPVKNVVHIKIPNKPVTITRIGGTETMTVDTFTLDGTGANRNVVAKEPFTFRVGGTLHVNANQVEGAYFGTFDVEIQYP